MNTVQESLKQLRNLRTRGQEISESVDNKDITILVGVGSNYDEEYTCTYVELQHAAIESPVILKSDFDHLPETELTGDEYQMWLNSISILRREQWDAALAAVQPNLNSICDLVGSRLRSGLSTVGKNKQFNWRGIPVSIQDQDKI